MKVSIWSLLLFLGAVVLSSSTSCIGDDKGSTTSAATTSGSGTSGLTTGDSITDETTGGGESSTTGAKSCGEMTCAECAACMQVGECAELFATCSADEECLGYIECLIPDCIELGPDGEACTEMCFSQGDLLKAQDYESCVTTVCDPSCGFIR